MQRPYPPDHLPEETLADGYLEGVRARPEWSGAQEHEYERRTQQIFEWARRGQRSWLWRFLERRVGPRRTDADVRERMVDEALRSVVDGAPQAILLLAANGRLLYANDAAKRYLGGRPFRLHHGAVQVADPDLQGTFDTTFRGIFAGHAGSGRVGLRSSDVYLTIESVRLVPESASTPAVAAVTVHSDDVEIDRSLLIAWYGLSDAEASVAADFAGGASLTEIAQARGVSMNTVRTHFARIRAKLDAPNQAAVVRRVLHARILQPGRPQEDQDPAPP